SESSGRAAAVRSESSSNTRASYSRVAGEVIAVLFLLVLAAFWWVRHSGPKTASTPVVPELELTYRLHAQKLRAGKPYGEEFFPTGQQVFDSNWRIRLDFPSRQPGSLYVLDQGSTPRAAAEFSLFFPLPGTNNGVAQVAAGQTVETDWARFQER